MALSAAAAAAGTETSAPSTVGSAADSVLDRLIEESLSTRPELRQAQASLRAERSQVPQAGALPDPVVTLGIQNDSFENIEIGTAETSFYQVMVSQGLPWPGKRGLRTDMARLSADQAAAGVRRVRLTTEADVRRAYLDLLLVRERLGLLSELQGLWEKSSGTARSRYESGDAAQSDVLRAQLELSRLRQRVFVLRGQESAAVQTLNRLRSRPLEEPIQTSKSVRDLGVPQLPPLEQALADAAQRSPELELARLGAMRADKETALARRERFPDLNVNFGVMPRGDLDPMWAAGLSFSVPLWSYRKQNEAVTESEARSEAQGLSAEAVAQMLRLRVTERHTAMEAVIGTIQPYRDGLLVQSQATADSTLSQYRVGRVTFASVLEANAGYVNDQESYLSALADAQRIAIADAEISLDPVSSAAGGAAMNTGAIPGVGPIGAPAGPSSSGGGAQGEAGAPKMKSGM